MSRLLGPLSETISRVSDRASALAADQIAGAGTMAPAAAPVTDLRKSRRFMVISSAWQSAPETDSQGSCQDLRKPQYLTKILILRRITACAGFLKVAGRSQGAWALAYKPTIFAQ